MGRGSKKSRESLGVGTMTMIMIGTLMGVGADFMWNSLNLPGRNKPLQGCPAWNEGDVAQVAIAAGLTFIGFLTGSRSLPAFTFGIATGMLIPKVFTPYLHMPRYGIFDFDPGTGTAKPIGRLPTL